MRQTGGRYGRYTRTALIALVAIQPVAAGTSRAAARPDLARLPAILTDSGAAMPVAALRGKPVLVNFWASWCIPCRAELPSLDRLAAKRGDLVIVAVSVDADRREAEKAYAGRYPHLRLGYAPIGAVQAYGALGIPYSVVFDRHGNEVARVPRALAWDVGGSHYLRHF